MPGEFNSHISDQGHPVTPQPAVPVPTPQYPTRTNTYAYFETATQRVQTVAVRTETCRAIGLWVMGAVETTQGTNGIDIVLNDIFCQSIDEHCHITGMPNFAATPISATPVVLTTSVIAQTIGVTPSTDLDSLSSDQILKGQFTQRPPVGQVNVLAVQIHVNCWQLNGQPAANVQFSWICTAEGVITARASA